MPAYRNEDQVIHQRKQHQIFPLEISHQTSDVHEHSTRHNFDLIKTAQSTTGLGEHPVQLQHDVCANVTPAVRCVAPTFF